MTRFLILHNVHDKASREFVAAHEGDPDVEVLDWNYEPDLDEDGNETSERPRDVWLAAGGTLNIGAFPAVLFIAPEHAVDVIGEVPGGPNGGWRTERRDRPEGWEVVNLPDATPEHMDLAVALAAGIDALAAVTWVEAVAEQEPGETAEEAKKAQPFLDEAKNLKPSEECLALDVAISQCEDRLARIENRPAELAALAAVTVVEDLCSDGKSCDAEAEQALKAIDVADEAGAVMAPELRARLDAAPSRRPA